MNGTAIRRRADDLESAGQSAAVGRTTDVPLMVRVAYAIRLRLARALS